MVPKKDTTKILLDYLEEKYGESFSFVEVTGGSLGSTEKSIIVSSRRYPEAKIIARRVVNQNGEEQFSDNYMAYVFRQEVFGTMKEAFGRVYRDYKVAYVPTQMPLAPDIGPDTALEDYMVDTASQLDAVIFIGDEISEQNRDEKLEQLRMTLKELGLNMGATLIFTDHEALAGIDEEDYSSYEAYLLQSSLPKLRCDFLLDEDFEFIYADWR